MNKQEEFRRYVSAEIYEYIKKNQSNVLHLKGIKAEKDQSSQSLTEEIREFIQDNNRQSNIVGCFATRNEKLGAWANITFSTYEETKQAYEATRQQRIRFKDVPLYASLRNAKDTRTVAISTVKKNITNDQMRAFLSKLASESKKVESSPDENRRKYDFFSFNILDQKTFFIDNDGEQIGKTEDEDVPTSWREMNTVPRRVVIHFIDDIKEDEIKDLIADIKNINNWEEIFSHI